MLPQPRISPDQTYEHRITPLRWLAAELEDRAVMVVLVPDPIRAYLRAIHGAASLTVRLDTEDDQHCYRWDDPPTTHPLSDPDGAARRLTTMLRGR